MEFFKLFLCNISEEERGEKKPEQNCVVPLEEEILIEAHLKAVWEIPLQFSDRTQSFHCGGHGFDL